MMKDKITATFLKEMKSKSIKITSVTAYDYPSAKFAEEAGIDVVLVGDSLGMVVLGYENTLPVTVEEMLHHTKAVRRGLKYSLLVADMPFMSYQAGNEDAVRNAGRLVKEGGAEAVKVEGGEVVLERIKAILDAGIPVMGHLGLTPQYINKFGGYKVQGRTEKAARQIIEDSRALDEMGAFSIVLECVPAQLAGYISKNISIPTIGIGAGKACDGQVLVYHDILGLFSEFIPKHVKRYADLKSEIVSALKKFKDEVNGEKFPSEEHGFLMDEEILKKVVES